MTLRMGDGPVKNLPPGLDAYAGYVQNSGIGETWNEVQQIPAKYHLSISVIPGVMAMTGDVEAGALNSWRGYTVGYCSISRAQNLIDVDGRPEKLWTAHYTGIPHLCDSTCGYGFRDRADGTQWTDHGGAWDESLLADDFFSFLDPTPIPSQEPDMIAEIWHDNINQYIVWANGTKTRIPDPASGSALVANPAFTYRQVPTELLAAIPGG